MKTFIFILIASSLLAATAAESRVAANGASIAGMVSETQSIDRVAVNGVATTGTTRGGGKAIADSVVLPSGETIAVR